MIIHKLGHENADEVADVLWESFYDYPVMRFVLGTPQDYDHQLRLLMHFFVMARVFRDEVLLGIGDPGAMAGVALVSYPARHTSPPELDELRNKLWDKLGEAARKRYEAFGAACAPFQPNTPHLHLNMIGVRGTAQGQGVGRRLMDHVHQLSMDDSASSGVSLTTEDASNVPLYEHLGYDIVGEAQVEPGLRSWSFFRRDQNRSTL